MKKSLSVLWAALLAVGFLLLATPEASSIKKANDAVKQVMKEAHKDGLLKKVMGGEAKSEEKEKLLALYILLWDAGCPAGDADSWTDKSGALVVAAAKVVAGRDDANDALKAASNCGNCHKIHKKKRLKIGAGNLIGPAERIAAALTGAAEPKYSVKEIMKQVDALDDDERILFFYSDALDDIREGFYFVSDKKVVIYSETFGDAPLSKIAFDEIAHVELVRDTSWLSDSEILLELNDSIMCSFPVSSELDKDQLFFEAIRSRLAEPEKAQ